MKKWYIFCSVPIFTLWQPIRIASIGDNSTICHNVQLIEKLQRHCQIFTSNILYYLESRYIMTAKIAPNEYVFFIKPPNFETAAINYFTVS